MKNNLSLMIAGVSSFALALCHVVIIFVGPSAYDYFDIHALALLAAQGSWIPALVTSCVIGYFVVCGLYAFSGAGMLRRLPWLRAVLIAIGAIYFVRGLAIFWFAYLWLIGSSDAMFREIIFSLGSLLIGISYLFGVKAMDH